LAVVGFLSAGLFLTNLNDRDLWPSHEARAAQNAAGFLETGRWGVLRGYDGAPDLQKPPLYYWMVAGFAWLRGGVDATAVRLPSAAAGWLLTLLVSFTLRHRPVAALTAGVSLATACHFVAIARTGRIDVTLALAVAAAVISVRGRDRPLTAAASGGYAIAAALLLKGPVGLALVIAVGLAVLVVDANAVIGSRYFALAIALGVAFAAPWFLAATLETNGDFARSFFWHHNVERVAGTADDLASHPVWFYFARWIVDWLPWSPAAFAAGWHVWRRGLWWNDADLRFGAAWAAAVTLVLTLSHFKRADYLIPGYAGAAMAFGCVAEQFYMSLSPERRSKAGRWAAFSLVGVVASYVSIQAILIPRWDRQCERRTAAAVVRQWVEPGRQVVFFRVEDHLLALHLGKPIATVLEWENLAVWASGPQPRFIIMPAVEAAAWPTHLTNATLHEVARLADRTGRHRPRDLVVFSTVRASNVRTNQPHVSPRAATQ